MAVNVPSTGAGQLAGAVQTTGDTGYPDSTQRERLRPWSAPVDVESLQGWHGGFPDQAPNNGTSNGNVIQLTVAAGPCRLYGFQGVNSNAAARNILVFDTASPVANGAVPVFGIVAPLGGNFSWSGGYIGRWFDRGVVIATSTTLATLTLGTADMLVDAQWI